MHRVVGSGLVLALWLAGATWAPGPAAAERDGDAEIRNGVLESAKPANALAPVRAGAHRPGAHVTLTFNTGSAPCLFKRTQALRDEFADFGVHFRGSTGRRGAAILHQCGEFGLRARSGRQFLAFNTETYAKPPQHIRFDDRQRSVVLYAGSRAPSSPTYRLVASRAGAVVATRSSPASTRAITGSTLSTRRGFDTLVLTVRNVTTFVVDDLTFTPR